MKIVIRDSRPKPEDVCEIWLEGSQYPGAKILCVQHPDGPYCFPIRIRPDRTIEVIDRECEKAGFTVKHV